METITSKTRPVGNSSGVLLPRNWLNKKVVVTLAELSEKEILKEVIEILYNRKILDSVSGIYIVGSYARREQTETSDVDIFVITKTEESKHFTEENYSITLVSVNELENILKKNVLPLLPMIKEAKALLNAPLLEQYKDVKLTKKNLGFYIETTKSALEVNYQFMKISEELKEKCPDSVAYSLILRLRGIYIVDCLIKEKMWSKKNFLALLKKVSGSTEAYEGYLRIKNNKKRRETLEISQAKKIIDYISKKIKSHEEWVKRKR